MTTDLKVHLRQIPAGETLMLEGQQDAAFLGLEEAGVVPLGPLDYQLFVGLSDGGLFATGRLSVKARFKCVACLEDFESEVVIDSFAMQKELDGREIVDLEPEVREDIQLALPAYPRCDAEGRKTCPASFPRSPVEVPPPAGATAWDALDKLKTDN